MNSYTINLLPKKKSKVADKLLYFVLYYFRYIIVITQIIVIGVFFFRFREDQKVIDLKQKFRQKEQILAVTAPLVQEAQAMETQTAYIKSVLVSQDEFINKYTTVLKSIPSDITLKSLDVSGNLITIRGNSSNVASIRTLHRKLTLTPGLETAQIGTINSIQDGSFDFILEVLPSDNEK